MTEKRLPPEPELDLPMEARDAETGAQTGPARR